MRALVIAVTVLAACEAAAQEPRLFHVPTGYLAPEWGGRASAGIGSQGDLWAEAATGILKVADLEVTLGDEIRANGAVVAMPTAQFRMGVSEGRLAPWQPAVALGRHSSAQPATCGHRATLRGPRMASAVVSAHHDAR